MSDTPQKPNQQNPSNVIELNTGPDWKALADLYGQGAADVEIAKELGITIAQFYAMEQDIPEFADFVAKGRTLSQAWWVKMARTHLTNKDLNTALFNFNMKNRFGWADKIDTNAGGEEQIGDADSLQSALMKAVKRLAKKRPDLLQELTGAASEQG